MTDGTLAEGRALERSVLAGQLMRESHRVLFTPPGRLLRTILEADVPPEARRPDDRRADMEPSSLDRLKQQQKQEQLAMKQRQDQETLQAKERDLEMKTQDKMNKLATQQ